MIFTGAKHIITTNTKRHYISTVLMDGIYETMIFSKRKKIDWSGKEQVRTESIERATVNHCDAIWKAMGWESHAKNAGLLCTGRIITKM